MNWLLIRGLGRDKRHWYKFPDQLEQQLGGGKVFCIDTPGLDGEANSAISINSLSDHMREQWLKEKANHSGDWSICAISLGGMIAIDWCSKYPNDFNKLVTINTSSKSTSPLFHRIKPRAIKTVLKSLLNKDLKSREKEILAVTTNHLEVSDQILNDYVKIAETMNLNIVILLKQLLAASQFKLPAKIETPFTVLTGMGDNFTNYKCSEGIAKKYQAEIYYHKTAGHDLPSDDPEWVIKNLIS